MSSDDQTPLDALRAAFLRSVARAWKNAVGQETPPADVERDLLARFETRLPPGAREGETRMKTSDVRRLASEAVRDWLEDE